MSQTVTKEICESCERDIPGYQSAFIVGGQIVCRECHDRMQPICPYCNDDLDSLPEIRLDCPSCNRTMFVRPEQTTFPSVLLTAKQAIIVDGMKELRKFGITEDDFFRRKGIMTDEEGAASDGDVILALFDDLIDHSFGHGELADAYDSLSRFLYNAGMDPFEARKKWAHAQLLNWQKSQVCHNVSIESPDHACGESKQFADKKFTIREAIDKLPIPCAECTFKRHPDEKYVWCCCDYKPVR